MPSNKIWTLPNLITLFRVLLTPGFVIAYLDQNFFVALILFIIAGFSDALDGFLARVLDQRSEFGSMIDPLADKILLITSFLCLSAQGYISNWLTVLVISRDMIIVGGLSLLKFYGANVEKKISPLWSSKFTTALQLLVVFMVLCRLAFGVNLYFIQAKAEFLTAFFTLISGAIYLRKGMAMFNEIEAK
ncbi:CDP-diacylglycerol--glycerol-3-phosphate 3-phosphatidyltransferase [Maridesulfovibrio zosterae]|uniref:CDP-diacylglycerol--glycerol-3-phosphate 3-phosphatidyltransferase n=1 Tax=Maridesulfovibrio zosterae TaxID=82171 RepID=UPI0004821DB4|nr:CDP-diacylglycerol--glycerol-3-phosphate 3-phosphatidyltransferase [Maridesulfovibrio zosterae]